MCTISVLYYYFIYSSYINTVHRYRSRLTLYHIFQCSKDSKSSIKTTQPKKKCGNLCLKCIICLITNVSYMCNVKECLFDEDDDDDVCIVYTMFKAAPIMFHFVFSCYYLRFQKGFHNKLSFKLFS